MIIFMCFSLSSLTLLLYSERFTQHQMNIKQRSKKLTTAAEKGDYKELRTAVQGVAECVAMLENHCTVVLVQEALKDWYKALDYNGIPCECECVLYDNGVAFPCAYKDCILLAVMMHVHVAQF